MIRVGSGSSRIAAGRSRNALLAGCTVLSAAFFVMMVGSAKAVVVGQWNFGMNAAWDLTQTTPDAVAGVVGTTNPELGRPASIYWDATRDFHPNVSGLTVGKTNVIRKFASSNPHAADGAAGPGSWVGNFGGSDDGSGITTGAQGAPIYTQTVNVTHHNRNLPLSSETLQQTVLLDKLKLVPHDIAGVAATLQMAFNVMFKETNNFSDVAPTPHDVFVIEAVGETIVDNTIQQPFLYDPVLGIDNGQQYIAHLRLDGLDQLTDEQCAAAGAANGCVGLLTAEDTSKSFQVSVAITAVPVAIAAVPLPPAMVLLLTALAGLGVIARQNRKKGQSAPN